MNIVSKKRLYILYLQKLKMIKRKSQSKKKKLLNNNTKNQKVSFFGQPQKFIFKFSTRLGSAKPSNLNSFSQTPKVIKSGTTTPSSQKLRKSKENTYQSIFCTKKTSETMAPFDYQKQIKQSKCRSDYCFLFQIGSGGFGRVWKAEQKKTGTIFAMKEMSKAKIIAKKSVASIMNQKQLLDDLNNAFIINSHLCFQDRDNLYLAMQYLRGGDLRYHMCFYQYFDQQQTKFIVSCIVLSLQYIHSCNIIHRDLKPQNIVFEENGYARITDFGVARKRKENNSQETSGTPGYMSPEVICRMNHSFEADFFALGVIIYELIFGTRPYLGDSRKEIREKILAHQAKINERDLPPGWSPSCIDFVNRLLKRNKQSRLGYNGISEIKNHPWLKSTNWAKLSRKQITPFFIPGIVCQSQQYQQQMQNSVPSQINQQAVMLLRTPQIQKLFKNYDSVPPPPRKTMPVKFQSQGNSLNSTGKFVKKML